MRNAVIDIATGKVVNVIELEPYSEWQPPEGHAVVRTDEGSTGYTYVDGVFTPPPLLIPAPEQLLQANQQELRGRESVASQAMAPLLLILQLGEATDSEIAAAKAWQAYYRELQLVDLAVASPVWPSPPD